MCEVAFTLWVLHSPGHTKVIVSDVRCSFHSLGTDISGHTEVTVSDDQILL